MSKPRMANISKLLKSIADRIDKYPNFLFDLEKFIVDYAPTTGEGKEKEVEIDIWNLYAKRIEEFGKVMRDN